MRAHLSRAASIGQDPNRGLLRLRTIERLEPRLLLSAATLDDGAQGVWQLAQPCSCPQCRSALLIEGDAPVAAVGLTSGPAAAPLTSVPLLSSDPAANAKIFLDFDGRLEPTWAYRTNVTTPAFDLDGNVTDFSTSELAAIQEIWARVAEDYAPFNIDVTTIDPGHQTDRGVAVVAIGGSYSDWYGSAAGGVAFVGGFANFSPNVGYVFAQNLVENARNVAEAASHEAGHLLGLSHQSLWSGTTLSQSYNSGNGNWAPIMGSSYSGARSTWHDGTTSAGSTVYQDDLAIIAGSTNGFGYKADDFGSTISTASALPGSGTSVSFAGLIGRSNDQDVWSFTTSGGAVALQLTGAAFGSNLDAVLELANSQGVIIASHAPAGSLGASLSLSVGAGTYYLIARGAGDYGNLGQYTIAGSLPSAATGPSARLSVSGAPLANGGTLGLGTTTVGTSLSRTITVTNTGTTVLLLSPLSSSGLPTGFSLVSNLPATSLSPGVSTTLVIHLSATSAGNFSGQISLATNDPQANPYTFRVTGTVTAPTVTLSSLGTTLDPGDSLSFGSTTVGTAVARTITVTNTGNALLTLSLLDGHNLPLGFSLVQNLHTTTLLPGASTTFILGLTASAAGSFRGQFTLMSNDPISAASTFTILGTVTPAADRTIVDDGDSGNRLVGAWNTLRGRGYAGDIRTATTGSSTFTAWNFTNLPAGQFQVFATWTPGQRNATNAPFTILSGQALLKSVRLNQKTAPGGAVVEGVSWRFLGAVVVSNGHLLVKLTNHANGLVVADAIRIQQVVPTGADLAATVTDVGAGINRLQSAPRALFTSRAAAEQEAEPLPLKRGTVMLPDDDSFCQLLDLLASARVSPDAEPAVDQILAASTDRHADYRPAEKLLP